MNKLQPPRACLPIYATQGRTSLPRPNKDENQYLNMSIIGLESRHISLFLWHLPVGERQKKIEISFSFMYLYDRKKQSTKMLRNLKISKMTRSVGFFCIQFLLRLCSIILLKYHQSTRERLADFINRGLMILFEEYWTVITYKKGIFRKLWKKGLKNIIHSNKYKVN